MGTLTAVTARGITAPKQFPGLNKATETVINIQNAQNTEPFGLQQNGYGRKAGRADKTHDARNKQTARAPKGKP